MFTKIAVFGLGLLGGSLCKAVKSLRPEIEVRAFGRNRDRLEPALRGGFADRIGSLEEADLTDVDFIMVSMPAVVSIDMIRQILGRIDLDGKALVIDVGSVKERVVAAIADHPRSGQFVGCHPMAGSEKMGFEFSRSDLYERASVIVTPHERNRPGDVERVLEFWRFLGALPVVVPCSLHDACVARTSHMPHLVSAAVTEVLAGFTERELQRGEIRPFMGPGFRDVTRLAAGSPEMWRDIVELNNESIGEALKAVIGELQHLKRLMENPVDTEGIYQYLSRAKKGREEL